MNSRERTADGGTPGSGDAGGADGGTPGSGDAGGADGESNLDPAAEDVLAEIRDLDPAEITPAELLSRIEDWQSDLE